MVSPLLIISGPTASGKTSLAIKLAKLLNGELISADSRQIYKGFDIGTGKDHPKNIKIHLIDIINPDQQFSVSQYRELALKTIDEIYKKNRLPIIVGGSGQYIESIINPSKETFSIKPNKLLRFFLNKFSLQTLQFIYKTINKEKYLQLNHSDVNNPHRLIRKIEINLAVKFPFCLACRQAGQRGKPPSLSRGKGILNYVHISLTAPNSFLFKNIDQRVDERIKQGLEQEIINLRKKYKWSCPAFRTHAYKEFKNGFTPENIKKWHYDEHRYVHRQKSYFKRIPNIKYFDITSPKYPQSAIDFIKKCYN